MRSRAFVSIFPLVSMVTAVAHAQVAPTPAGFGSNANYIMGNPSCSNLKNITVSLHVTEDIVVASTACVGGLTGDGFSLQLNANAPNTIDSLSGSDVNTASAWQQYVMIVGQSPVAPGLNNITEQTQLWANTAGDGKSNPDELVPVPGTALPDVTLPAGYTLTWELTTDSTSGNVTKVKYSVTDPQGDPPGSYTQSVDAAYQAPIADFELDIVGQPSCTTTFKSGAGVITYSSESTPFTAESQINPVTDCAGGNRGPLFTSETSNSAYATLALGSSTFFTQEFYTPYTGEPWGYGGDFWGQNFGFQWSPTTTLSGDDWSVGDYKGECEPGQPLMGVSASPTSGIAHSVFCGNVKAFSAYPQSTACYGRPFGVPAGGDSRGATAVTSDDSQFTGGDWDPTYYKGECQADEFIAGVSQSTSGVEDGVLCCPGSVAHTACEVRAFSSGNSGFTGPDWDFGFYKGQCPVGQYVAGVSSFSSGLPHAVLCCNRS